MHVYSEPRLQIRSDCILAYNLNLNQSFQRFNVNASKQQYSGLMQSHAQKRIMRAVDLMLQRNPKRRIYNPVSDNHHDFQIGFCTLTIPRKKAVTASEAHRNLLQPFLRTARRKWNVSDYIWKAELQQRGQLHYHITWTEFVHLTDIRDCWNSLLRKHRYSEEYAKRFGHYHCNSTDIHAVWKVKNLKAYLSKYIAKQEQNKTALDGKVWDCNKELKGKMFDVCASERHKELIDDAVASGICKKIALDNCTIYKLENPAAVLSNFEAQQYKQFLK